MTEGPFFKFLVIFGGEEGLEDNFSMFGSLHFVAHKKRTRVSHALLVVKVVSSYSSFCSAA